MNPENPITEEISILVPTAIFGSVFRIFIIAGSLILPRTRPTIPPSIPTKRPIID